MAQTSSSLKEFENFSRHLGSYLTQIDQGLLEYKNQVNQVVDATLGGTQALGEAAFEAVNIAMKDLSNKAMSLQDFLKKAAESKSDVASQTAQDASNVNYGG